ncbi:hypothetical protein FDP41_013150 [Naegleria fowleri]|uniref:F-box domain-containing protein n=1 Tax=Naegleria fowleri TaxID=5763 RepID=A0A6A5BTY7_NAEFO|nr:uncharacterized protein FDP41_013150 [Naegleria fowleri]KAF0980667.1 hypothetical protein FDP41_013150 [Naegleria fowleri]CAG4712794.1 unnamed protein product [Naegleria fowleri]
MNLNADRGGVVLVSVIQPPMLCHDEKKNCKFVSENEMNQLMISYCERLMNGVDGMSEFVRHLSEETMKSCHDRVIEKSHSVINDSNHEWNNSELEEDNHDILSLCVRSDHHHDFWNQDHSEMSGLLNALNELSDEILQLIFQFVDNQTLQSVMLSGSRLYQILSQPQFWKDKCENEGLQWYNYYFKRNNQNLHSLDFLYKKFYTKVIARRTVFNMKHSNGKIFTFTLASHTSMLTCFSHFGVIYIDPSLYYEFNTLNCYETSHSSLSLISLLSDTLYKCYSSGLKILCFLIDFASLHNDEMNHVKEVLHNSLEPELQLIYNKSGYLGSPIILDSNSRTLQGIIDRNDGGPNLLTHILTEISKLSHLTRSIRMQNYKRLKQKTVKIVNHWSPYTKLPPKSLELR